MKDNNIKIYELIESLNIILMLFIFDDITLDGKKILLLYIYDDLRYHHNFFKKKE